MGIENLGGYEFISLERRASVTGFTTHSLTGQHQLRKERKQLVWKECDILRICSCKLHKMEGIVCPRGWRRQIPAHTGTFIGQNLGLSLLPVGSLPQTNSVSWCVRFGIWLLLFCLRLWTIAMTIQGLELIAFDWWCTISFKIKQHLGFHSTSTILAE